MLKKIIFFYLIFSLILGSIFALSIAKPRDIDVNNKSFLLAELVPGQDLEIFVLKKLSKKEYVKDINFFSNDKDIVIKSISENDVFYIARIKIDKNASIGEHILNIKVNNETYNAIIKVYKTLLDAKIFFYKSSLHIGDKEKIAFFIENKSDSNISCYVKSNLPESWFKPFVIDLNAKSKAVFEKYFFAKNKNFVNINFYCNNYFFVKKKIEVSERDLFSFFGKAYPVINFNLSIFYSILNYLYYIF